LPKKYLGVYNTHSLKKPLFSFPAEIADYNGGSQFRWAYETEERNRLWKARHDIYWTVLQSNPGCRAIVTDVCVPITCLPDLIAQTKSDIQQSGIIGINHYQFKCAVFFSQNFLFFFFFLGPCLGHVGDGNFHTFLVFNPNKPEEFKKAENLASRMAK
jgi:D-lactate dehydrogenase (cytochrome)